MGLGQKPPIALLVQLGAQTLVSEDAPTQGTSPCGAGSADCLSRDTRGTLREDFGVYKQGR